MLNRSYRGNRCYNEKKIIFWDRDCMFKLFNKKNNKTSQDVWVVVGLGNPGPEYENTRHNCGFCAIDKLINKIGANSKGNIKFKGKYYICDYKGQKVVLLKPQTYMNGSGESVDAVMNWFKIDETHLIVIYDDYAIDTEQIRIKSKGSAGSHNGMKSVIQYVGTDIFTRIKVGIGPKNPNFDTSKFVLGHFGADEKVKMDKMYEIAADAALFIIDNGVDNAMNKYNTKVNKNSNI